MNSIYADETKAAPAKATAAVRGREREKLQGDWWPSISRPIVQVSCTEYSNGYDTSDRVGE